MYDYTRSNLTFFHAHKGSTLLLASTLILLFFLSLILHGISLVGNFEIEDFRSERPLMYEVYYAPANQSATESLIARTYELNAPVAYLNTFGVITLLDPKSLSDTSSNTGISLSQSNDNDSVPTDSNFSITKYSVMGLDPKCTLPIDIIRGTSPLDGEGIMPEAFFYESLSRFLVFDETKEGIILLENGETLRIVGVGSLRTWMNIADFIIERGSFFSTTDSSNSIQVVYSRPLSAAEEEEWIKSISEIVSIVNVTRPQDSIISTQEENNILLLFSRMLILICLLCALRLMTYLFLLRKQEFIVLRMLGADNFRITAYIISMLLMIAGVAIVGGYLLYIIVISFPITSKVLYPLSSSLILSDILFFLIAVLMSGISMFFLNKRVDVTQASEEV